jgi:hypothetical protein
MAVVHEWTIPTEWPPLVGEIIKVSFDSKIIFTLLYMCKLLMCSWVPEKSPNIFNVCANSKWALKWGWYYLCIIFIVANKTESFYICVFSYSWLSAMMQLHYHVNEASQSSWPENKYRLHVDMLAAIVDDINLLAIVLITKVIRCVLEAESLCNSYNKCSA